MSVQLNHTIVWCRDKRNQVRQDVEKELRNWASNVAQAYSAATGRPTFWQDKGPITEKVLNALAFSSSRCSASATTGSATAPMT